MRRLIALSIALLLATPGMQAATPEAINTILSKTEWLKSSHQYGGACIRIRSTPIVIIDPAGISEKEYQTKADIIIVTHTHDDHFSPEIIASLRSSSTTLVGPTSVTKEVAADPKLAGMEVITVQTRGTYLVKGITIEPIPAYSLVSKAHPEVNGWVGYVLTMDGVRIYCTGDTSFTPAMDGLKDIDIVVANYRGPYQLGRDEVVELARLLKPQVLIPIHWLASEKGDVDFINQHTPMPTRLVRLIAQ